MTKVGEGKSPSEKPLLEQYHKELEQSAAKFLNALESYNGSSNADEKKHLKDLMDQQLALIRAAVTELRRAGIYKQEVKVESDYRAYLGHSSSENFAALEHDLTTLREYNKLP